MQPMTGRLTPSRRTTTVSVARILATTNTATSITRSGRVRTVARKPPERTHSPTAANPVSLFQLCRAKRNFPMWLPSERSAKARIRPNATTTHRRTSALLGQAQAHAADIAAAYFPSMPVEAIDWEGPSRVTIRSEEVAPYRLFRQSRKLGTESCVLLEVLPWSH